MTAPDPSVEALSAAEKRALLERMLAERAAKPRSYPLSYAQQRLWFLDRLAPGNPAYHVRTAVRIDGLLPPSLLAAALAEIVRRHKTLRTTFAIIDDQPVQMVAPAAEPALTVIDLDGLPADRHESEARRIAGSPAAFDLETGPLLQVWLLRLAPATAAVVISMHHILSDGWSLDLFRRELGTLCAAFAAGRSSPLPPLPLQYIDFAVWQRRTLSGEALEPLAAWWQARLSGTPPVLELPTDRPRPPIQRGRGAGIAFRWPAALRDALATAARPLGATLFMALLAGFQALLLRYSGQEDFCIGTPVAGRNREELTDLIGLFADVLVLRTDLEGDPTFQELLGRVRESTLSAFSHQGLPFEKLVEILQPPRDTSHSPLFQVSLALQNTPIAPVPLPGLTLTPLDGEREAAKYDLVFELVSMEKGIDGVLEFDRDLFDRTTALRLVAGFERLLAAAVDPTAADTPLSRRPLLPESERHQLLAEWNDTVRTPDWQPGVHRRIAALSRQRPGEIAVTWEGRELTRGELAARVRGVARGLRALGIGPEVVVAVSLERSLEMLIALLGILEAGGAYLPLDPNLPADRREHMLRDSGAAMVLTQPRVVELEAGWEDEQESLEPLAGGAGPDNLAYILYTSGSTGRPKGVQVPHRALDNFLESMRRAPGLRPDDTLLALTSLSFDIAALELYLPLLVGARLEIAPAAAAADGARLRSLLRSSRATVMQATPSGWRVLLAGDPHPLTPSPARTHTLPGEGETWKLRLALTGGEALPAVLAAQLLARADEVWNLYGPTETAVWSTIRRVTPADTRDGATVSLGRPIANTALHLVDAAWQPVPLGAAGELWIGGLGVARGYLNRPDLTADRFVPDPFAGGEGLRLYRTGDLARFRADGTLQFLGRADQQVKVHGFRIEPGEIEAVLARQPGIERAVVIVRNDDGGSRLVAYVVPSAGAAPEPGDLRRALRESLPEPMVPAAFVFLERLPLTPNGKLDRRALPAPARPTVQSSTAPRTEIEKTLASIWAEVLGGDLAGRVSIDDNFFDLGGHSLKLVEVQSRIHRALGRDVSVIELFQHPTIAALASHLAGPAADRTTASLGDRDLLAARERAARRELGVAGGFAVVGMAGRFPGAEDLDTFWANLRDGVESITPFTDQEMLAAGVDPALLASPGYVKAGPVLAGIDLFDAELFGFSPREAEILDPQQRLFLECAWEALESAGYGPGSPAARAGGPVGVYAGAQMSSYAFHLFTRPDLLGAVGLWAVQQAVDKDFLPTRVSYELDLKGPSLGVQTACSTSLVAVHLACQALRTGECDMALAGGVAVRVPDRSGYLWQEAGVMSPDGHCRAYDAAGRGTVFGSGVGIVVLKRLEDALRDGDTVRAVIRGTAINNDGSLKVGYTAPSVEGQAQVIAAAQAAAGVAPETITYVEGHGTATPLGDPVEVAALTRAFRTGTDPSGYCALGSVKTNIGHLDTAAGVAGLIKTVLALEHRQIPPSLHFQQPNPQIDFAASPFYVNTALADWPAGDSPRRAGVSSFGVGGTNAHAVLEEAPPVAAPEPDHRPQLLVLSARTPAALEAATERLAAFLEKAPSPPRALPWAQPERPLGPENADGVLPGAVGPKARADSGREVEGLTDLAWTLQTGRRSFPWRRTLVAASREDAAAALRDPSRLLTRRVEDNRRAVAFLFPGQGAQHPGMARGLYDSEPVFQSALDTAAERLAGRLGGDLRDLLYAADQSEAASRLRETRFAQPALFAVEHALARLWLSWGIEPAAMIGHSVGEYVAACLAGVFTPEDALDLVAERGALMQELPPGAMLSIDLPAAELAPLLGSSLSLAAVNSPSLCVAAGPEADIQALAGRLTASGIGHRRLHTSHAFHSAMMDPAVEAFAARVAHTPRRPPARSWISNRTGRPITAEEAIDPRYWASHLRETVRFGDGLARLLAGAPDGLVLLEVGPGRSLSDLARRQIPPGSPHEAVPSLRHPREETAADDEALLRALGRLWLAGIEIDWTAVHAGESRRRIPIPTYPFQRKRYWIEPRRLGIASDRTALVLPPEAAADPAWTAALRQEGWRVVTPAPGEPPAAVLARLRETVPEPAEPSVLPETESASDHDRPDLATAFQAPRTDAEQRLAGLWQELLGIARVGVHDDFFELGGHSLLGTRLASRVRETFGRELPLDRLFTDPTVARLAAWLEEAPAPEESLPPLVRAERTGELPLSFAQQRLFFLDVFSPGDASYNLALGLRLTGGLHPDALHEALRRLVARHEVLRTTFALSQGRAWQVIAPESAARGLELPRVDLTALPAAAAGDEAPRLATIELHRPFDLARGPVLRALLARRSAEEHLLLLTFHHIAADGWSWGVLYRELPELYQALIEGREPRLPELPIQYADFAVWQRAWLAGEALDQQIDYWRERLAGLPVLDVPGDRPRPTVRSGRGAALPVAMPGDLADALRRLARSEEATLFMVLLAGFLAQLHTYGLGDDLVVGTDVANRTRRETEGLIGLFVNQLVLRIDLAGDPSFRDLLRRVRRATLEAYAHQDAPFDKVVEALNPPRDPGRTPLFQTKLVLQNTPMEPRDLPGLTVAPSPWEHRTAKFDLLFNLVEGLGEGKNGIFGSLEHSTDLYGTATAERLLASFETVLRAVADRPEATLSEIAALLAERNRRDLERRAAEHRETKSRTVEKVRRKAIALS
jgi:amino acid adenylation domain-containing protein